MYADNELGGCSATGWGETIMKVVLSKSACDKMEKMSASEAVKESIAHLARRVNGKAGLVALDHKGGYGVHFNTQDMAYAYMDPQSKEIVAKVGW